MICLVWIENEKVGSWGRRQASYYTIDSTKTSLGLSPTFRRMTLGMV